MRWLCGVALLTVATVCCDQAAAEPVAEFVERLRPPQYGLVGSAGSVVSTDGNWAIAGGFVRGPGPLLFDLQSPHPIGQLLNAPNDFTPSVAITPQSIDRGTIVVTGFSNLNHENQVGLVYDAATGDFVRTLNPGIPREGAFVRFWTEGGKAVATGYGDPIVFDTSTGDVLATLSPDDRETFGLQSIPSLAVDDGLAVVMHVSGDMPVSDDFADAAYVFESRSGRQIARIVPPRLDEGIGFLSGTVAIDEGKVLLASWNDEAGQGAGEAYLFDAASGDLLDTLSPSVPDPDTGELLNPTDVSLLFGHSVALEGNTALIGSTFELSDRDDTGAAYLFDVLGGKQIQRLIRPGGRSTPSLFGIGAALADDWVIVGSARNGAYAYRLIPEPTAGLLVAIAGAAAASRGSRRGSRRRSG